MEQYFSTINESLEEMISYFSKLYSEHDALLKEYKAKLFEVNVKLDELTRTQNVYSLNTDYRKNVFSPIETGNEDSNKEAEIKKEIRSLKAKQNEYEYDINEETIYLKSIDKRIQKLSESKIAVGKLNIEFDKKTAGVDESEVERRIESEKEAVRRQLKKEYESKNDIDKDDLHRHMDKILMINAFDNSYYTTVLDKRVKNTISRNTIELEDVIKSIDVDPGLSKRTIKEVVSSQNNLISIVDDQLTRMDHSIDEKKGIRKALSDWAFDKRENYPDLSIDMNVGDLEHKPNYVRFYSIFRLIDIFFDNVVKHSKASHVRISLDEDDNKYKLRIKDDGIGLPDDYLSNNEWYSGINRAKEIAFLLSGKLSIIDDNGTDVSVVFDIE